MGKVSHINEDLFENEEDRRKIMSLPEVERETILFERQQRLEEVAEKRRLIEKVKALESGEASRPTEIPVLSKIPTEKQVLVTEDYESIRSVVLSRKFIEAYVFHPEFTKMAKGCYVRLALDKGIYRLCEIVKIVSMPPYRLEADVLIDKGALLRQGKSEKEFKFDVISNSAVTTAEIDYFVALEAPRKPKNSILTAKARELYEFKKKPLQDDVLDHILFEKKRVRGYGGIKDKVKMLADEDNSDAKKSRDFKYATHTFLKLESVSNDPNDPFARRKGFQSKPAEASRLQQARGEVINFKFYPQLQYEMHDFELDTTAINSLF